MATASKERENARVSDLAETLGVTRSEARLVDRMQRAWKRFHAVRDAYDRVAHGNMPRSEDLGA